MRRLTLYLAVATLVAGTASCGDDESDSGGEKSNGIAEARAAEVLKRAGEYASTLDSVTYVAEPRGKVKSGTFRSEPNRVHVRYAAGSKGVGQVMLDGRQFFFKLDKRGWIAATDDPEAASLLGGRWFKGPQAPVAEQRGVLLSKPYRPGDVDGLRVVNRGVEVGDTTATRITFIADGDRITYFVAETGEPRVLRRIVPLDGGVTLVLELDGVNDGEPIKIPRNAVSLD